MEKEILNSFSISLRMGKIEVGFFLSIILGNYGLNIVKLCKELNDFIKELLIFFLLEIKIIIFIDKIYIFIINEFSIFLLLRLVLKKKEVIIKIFGGNKIKKVDFIKLKDIYLIFLFKYGNILESFLKFIYGILFLLNFYVDK